MENSGDNIRNSLLKRQNALEKFTILKYNFSLTKERITREIEEARTLWKKTFEKLPNHPFK